MMKKFRGERLPVLSPSQFSLVQVDVWTGKVLTVDGEMGNLKDHDWVLIFDNLDEAEQYAQQRIGDVSGLSCSIYNYNGKFVKEFVNKGRIREAREAPKPTTHWWKFWKWRLPKY